MNTGLIHEGRKIKDYVFYPKGFPLCLEDRRGQAERLPVFYQNGNPECVLCSLDFISHWFSMGAMRPYVEMSSRGVKISKALEIYKKRDRIPPYHFLHKPTLEAISEALVRSPLVLGLWNWFLVPGGHCLVALEIEGRNVLCINWAQKDKHDFVSIPLEDVQVDFAIAFGDTGEKPRLSLPSATLWKIKTELIALKRKLSYGKNS